MFEFICIVLIILIVSSFVQCLCLWLKVKELRSEISSLRRDRQHIHYWDKIGNFHRLYSVSLYDVVVDLMDYMNVKYERIDEVQGRDALTVKDEEAV